MKHTIEIRARAKAFTGQRVYEHSFMVDRDTGDVRVWDEVANHFTSLHCLSLKAIRRIQRKAEKEYLAHRRS